MTMERGRFRAALPMSVMIAIGEIDSEEDPSNHGALDTIASMGTSFMFRVDRPHDDERIVADLKAALG